MFNHEALVYFGYFLMTVYVLAAMAFWNRHSRITFGVLALIAVFVVIDSIAVGQWVWVIGYSLVVLMNIYCLVTFRPNSIQG